ncbi:MAG: hypothetical protein H7301_12490 [Cryobacterium sp.]|nr:hypothetical protein [Oligoflexia bacterium]
MLFAQLVTNRLQRKRPTLRQWICRSLKSARASEPEKVTKPADREKAQTPAHPAAKGVRIRADLAPTAADHAVILEARVEDLPAMPAGLGQILAAELDLILAAELDLILAAELDLILAAARAALTLAAARALRVSDLAISRGLLLVVKDDRILGDHVATLVRRADLRARLLAADPAEPVVRLLA